MHEVKAMTSAPRFARFCALATARLPGQPPQLTNPIISTGPVLLKAPIPLLDTLKSTVPGHKSSVCRQRIIPAFFFIIVNLDL